jgi:hypothetical protein
MNGNNHKNHHDNHNHEHNEHHHEHAHNSNHEKNKYFAGNDNNKKCLKCDTCNYNGKECNCNCGCDSCHCKESGKQECDTCCG